MSTFDIIHMINTYELAHKNQKISFPLIAIYTTENE